MVRISDGRCVFPSYDQLIPKATLERGDSKELELAKKQAVNYKNEKARSWQNNKYKMENDEEFREIHFSAILWIKQVSIEWVCIIDAVFVVKNS
jgi:hypothetical protein